MTTSASASSLQGFHESHARLNDTITTLVSEVEAGRSTVPVTPPADGPLDPVSKIAIALWKLSPKDLSPDELDHLGSATTNALHDALPHMERRELNRLADMLEVLQAAVERHLVALEQGEQA
ncbi:hypothetical protein [Ectothiorhodospira lacustris]|uniref:hypothetical protein n=1 Tax=Ectothiorhodospira lacustris TaxID=2899127 RepID=UPI001EE7DDF5|nr:hypothetical protein [Ectothiorhodospira lacustris]MCG5500480.1 hypothetical protein [Ectothiorhodospira lacustris]